MTTVERRANDSAEVVDLHSHWATERGYPLRTPEERAQQKVVWGSQPSVMTESEMADYLRRMHVRAMLDLGSFTRRLPPPELEAIHDYAIDFANEHQDVVLGNWLSIDPHSGAAGVRELRRCIDRATGIVGLVVSGTSSGLPASDPMYYPFYELLIDARAPVLVLVGYTGLGAGLPGGAGLYLEHCHPRYVDVVAARYADLTIIAGRPAWPWQSEMIAVLLHKPNVWYELHGWSPKHFTAELKHEIARRLQDRVMFGADFPLFSYERLVRDWRAEGFASTVLDKVFCSNAERLIRRLQTGT
jgi:uncharacterized protein